MDGRAHFRKAEQFAEKAAEYLGHGDGQDTASVWAAVAQVHATLAIAAGLQPRSEPELDPTPSIETGMIPAKEKERIRRQKQYPDDGTL